jgi:hypothetical protein
MTKGFAMERNRIAASNARRSLIRVVGFAVMMVPSAAVLAQQPAPNGNGPAASAGTEAENAPVRERRVKVIKSDGVLPNKDGQVFRQYDLTPYLDGLASEPDAEQAVIDWILRETGSNAWSRGPISILNARGGTLTVYHTTEMQDRVVEVLERFMSKHSGTHSYSVRLATIGSPNWRAWASSMMTPVNVQSPGVEAWLLSKENAALLLGEFRKRVDYREHNSPNVVIHNGQTHEIARTLSRPYSKSVRTGLATYPGYSLDQGQVDEGYSLWVSPLLSREGDVIDAVLRCKVSQVEDMIAVPIDLTTPGGKARVDIQVPQAIHWQVYEQFRWPTNQVLLVSCGMTATPQMDRASAGLLPGILQGRAGRADAIMMLELNGKSSAPATNEKGQAKTADRAVSRGRY